MSDRDQSLDDASSALADALRTSFRLLRAALLLLVLAYLLSGIFVVRQDEKALVLLFGRVTGAGGSRVKGPGIHWTLPQPVARIVRLRTEGVRTVQTGALPSLPEGAPPEAMPPPQDWRELLLTGDANLIGAQWALRYTVDDVEAYRFGFENVEAILSHELRHAIVKTTARFRVDAALRTDVDACRAAIEQEIRSRSRRLGFGVRVERVDVLGLQPPGQVAPSFDAVVRAEQDRSRAISEASAYATRRANETEGQAARVEAAARAYRERLIAEVRADADYFQKVREQYARHPRIVVQTLLQDALGRALSRVDGPYYLPAARDGGQQLRLWLGPPRSKPSPPGAGADGKMPVTPGTGG